MTICCDLALCKYNLIELNWTWRAYQQNEWTSWLWWSFLEGWLGVSGFVGGQGHCSAQRKSLCLPRQVQVVICLIVMWDDFLPALKCNVAVKTRCLKTAHRCPWPQVAPELPGMLEASNIRHILWDTLAILVWHAVFSSLWNTFKALADMPTWIPDFFSQVMQPQVTIFISVTCALLVCLVNMLHLSEARRLLTAQVQQHLLSSAVLSPSSRLSGFSICCPRSSEFSKCEGVNVWGAHVFVHACPAACGCVCMHTLGCSSGLLSCNRARDAVFSHPPPAVTVVSGRCSVNSGPWNTWRTVRSTNPPSYAEC